MVRRLVDVMAHDLGVPQLASDDPDGQALTCRCTFTALRLWMQAYCIDDGYEGRLASRKPRWSRNPWHGSSR